MGEQRTTESTGKYGRLKFMTAKIFHTIKNYNLEN
jgi:hypothetical protein